MAMAQRATLRLMRRSEAAKPDPDKRATPAVHDPLEFPCYSIP